MPLIEMSTRKRKKIFLGSRARKASKADNLATMCKLTVYRQCGILNISHPYSVTILEQPCSPLAAISTFSLLFFCLALPALSRVYYFNFQLLYNALIFYISFFHTLWLSSEIASASNLPSLLLITAIQQG
jgi:hypothetical protein